MLNYDILSYKYLILFNLLVKCLLVNVNYLRSFSARNKIQILNQYLNLKLNFFANGFDCKTCPLKSSLFYIILQNSKKTNYY